MFESLVASILNQYLGQYVENLDTNQLNISIWGGDVKLQNLVLKAEALSDLDLPITVDEGYLGLLTLKVPWKNLTTQPVVVLVNDLYLTAKPISAYKYDKKKAQQAAFALKQQAISNYESWKAAKKEMATAAKDDGGGEVSFSEKLVARIVENVQITIENVHIRYEDSVSHPFHTFFVGLTVRSLTIATTNSKWQKQFNEASGEQSFKLLALESFAIYMDELSGNESTTKGTYAERMRNEIAYKGYFPSHSFILRPVTSVAKATLSKTPGKEFNIPRFHAETDFDEFAVTISRSQYLNLILLGDLFSRLSMSRDYLCYRPQCSVKENPKLWWTFVLNCINSDIKKKNQVWTWKFLRLRRDMRVKYMDTYKELLLNPSRHVELRTKVERMEHNLSIDDILLYRQRVEASVKVKKEVPKQTGWFGGWFSSNPASGNEEKPAISDGQVDYVLSQEEKDEIHTAIEQDNSFRRPPKYYVMFSLSVSLNHGLVSLVDDMGGRELCLLTLKYSEATAKLEQRPSAEAFKIAMSLKSFSLTDDFSSCTNVRTLIGPDVRQGNDGIGEGGDVSSLFNLVFETNPINEIADSCLVVKAMSLCMFYNKLVVDEVIRFFRPPENSYLEEIQTAALNKLEDIKTSTRAGLEYVIETRKTMYIDLDVSAPKIFFPKSFIDPDAPMLLLDLGRLKITSDIQKGVPADGDIEALESLMYDKFKIELSDAQILIGSRSILSAELAAGEFGAQHILDKLKIILYAENSVQPKNVSIARLKVGGEIPMLNAHMSDGKFRQLMEVVKEITPSTDHTKEVSQRSTHPKRGTLNPTVSSRPSQAFYGDLLSLTSQVSGDESFESAQSSISNDEEADERHEALAVSQILVFTRFCVGSLRINICDERNLSHSIVFGNLENFQLEFQQRRYDQSISVILGSISLCISDSKGNAIPFIDSPKGLEQESETIENGLVHFTCVMVSEDSPEFRTKYEGSPLLIDVNIAQIFINVDRLELVRIVFFLQESFVLNYSNEDLDAQPSNQQGPLLAREMTTKKEGGLSVKTASETTGTMNFKFEFKRLTTQLSVSGDPIAEIVVAGASFSLCVETDGVTMTSGSLVEFAVTDLSAKTSLFPLILSVEGDKVFEFEASVYPENLWACQGSSMDLRLTMNGIRVVFLNRFVTTLLGYVNAALESLSAISSPVQFPEEKSEQLHVLKDSKPSILLQESDNLEVFKLKMDVDIKAPTVCVPQNSFRDDLVEVDLGRIRIRNEFEEVQDVDQRRCMDVICLSLTSVTVKALSSRGSAKRVIVKEIDSSINVRRCLDSECAELPNMKCSVKIGEIAVALAKCDYELLMCILSQNLGETVEEKYMFTPKNDMSTNSEANTHGSTKDDDKVKTTSSSGLSVDFEMVLDRISTSLFSDAERKEGLGTLSFESFGSAVKIFNSGKISSTALLGQISVSDTRPYETFYPTIVETEFDDVGEQKGNAVALNFVQDPLGNTSVGVDVNSLNIILYTQFIFALLDFASLSQDKDQKESMPGNESASVMTKPSGRAEGGFEKNPTECEDGLFIATLKMSKSSIALLENFEDPESKAFLLTMALSTRVISGKHQQNVDVNMNNIELLSCRISEKEVIRPFAILKPCAVNFSLCINPEKKHLYFFLDCFIMTVTYGDIQTALGILSTVSTTASKPEHEDAIELCRTEDYEMRELQSSRWFLEDEELSGSKPLIRQSIAHSEVSETLLMEIGSIVFTLVNNMHGNQIPVVVVDVSTSINCSEWCDSVSGSAEIDVQSSFFNQRLLEYEPILEPWKYTLSVSRSGDSNGGDLAVLLSSQEQAELTLSHALLSTLNEFATSLGKEVAQKRTEYLPYRVVNKTGCDIKYCTFDDQPELLELVLKNNSDVEVEFAKYEEPKGNIKNVTIHAGSPGVENKLLSFQIPGFDPVENVSLEKLSVQVHNLTPKKDYLYRVITELVVENGVKVCSIRSPLQIDNVTNQALDLGFSSENNDSVALAATIEPQNSFFVPVLSLYSQKIHIRPCNTAFKWSDEGIFWYDSHKKGLIMRKSENDIYKAHFYHIQSRLQVNWLRRPFNEISPCHILRICMPVVLKNVLPDDIYFACSTDAENAEFSKLSSNSAVPLYSFNSLSEMPLLFKLKEHRSKEPFVINSRHLKVDHCSLVHPTRHEDKIRLRFNFKLPEESGDGVFVIELYSPYWIVNNTLFPLEIAPVGKTKGMATHLVDVHKGSPHLFGFSVNQSSKFVSVRTSGYDFAEPFNIDTPGTSGVIEVKNVAGNVTDSLPLVCSISASYMTNLSKVVTFKPRYIMLNKSSSPLYVKQSYIADHAPHEMLPDSELPYFWDDRKVIGTKRHCCVSIDGDNWSPPFAIDTAGSFVVKIVNAPDMYVLRLEIKVDLSTLYCVFYPDYAVAPFYLENRTGGVTVSFKQKGEDKEYVLPPGCSKPYCYESILNPHEIIWRSISTDDTCTHDCSIKEPYYHKLQTRDDDGDSVTVYCLVIADGLSRILVFVDNFEMVEKIVGRVYGLGLENISSSIERVATASFKVRLRLAGVGISLVNRVPEELLYFTMANLHMTYQYLEKISTLSIDISRMQIDNQLLSTGFPVMLYPTPNSVPDEVKKPFLEIVVVKNNNRGNEDFPVETYKYLSVCAQMMSVKLDEQFAIKLADFANLQESRMVNENFVERGISYEQHVEDIAKTSFDSVKKTNYYFELLQLHPIQINITFNLVGKEDANDPEILVSEGPISYLLKTVGVTLSNVQNTPMRFDALQVSYLFASDSILFGMLYDHFYNQAIREGYKVLGSFDIIGNPIGLWNSVGSGVASFFYEPYKAVVIKESDIATGVSKGASELWKNTIGGTANSFSRIADSLGKGAAALSCDDDYAAERRRMRSERPDDFLEGLGRGGKSLLYGIGSAVSGVVEQPYQGAKNNGVSGFFKGMGKGAVGVLTKPLGSLVDAGAATLEGISSSAGYGDRVERVRSPRYIPPSKLVGRFSHHEADGHLFLRKMEEGVFRKDKYLSHGMLLNPGHDRRIIYFTNRRILIINVHEMEDAKLEYNIPFERILHVDKSNQGVVIKFKIQSVSVFGGGSRNSSKLSLLSSDRQVGEWLSRAYSSALKIFESDAAVYFDSTKNAQNFHAGEGVEDARASHNQLLRMAQ
eukprot:Nk52_evm10s859 gene=Nk52_evmTU10s859